MEPYSEEERRRMRRRVQSSPVQVIGSISKNPYGTTTSSFYTDMTFFCCCCCGGVMYCRFSRKKEEGSRPVRPFAPSVLLIWSDGTDMPISQTYFFTLSLLWSLCSVPMYSGIYEHLLFNFSHCLMIDDYDIWVLWIVGFHFKLEENVVMDHWWWAFLLPLFGLPKPQHQEEDHVWFSSYLDCY